MSEKLDYIIAAETQKATLYPDKDHWEIGYLKQAAAELAQLRAHDAQMEIMRDGIAEMNVSLCGQNNTLRDRYDALRAENERLTKTVEEARETIEKVKGSVVGDRRPENDLSNTYSRLAIANSCDEWLTANPAKDCPSCRSGLCPDDKGGYIPCTICGNTINPAKEKE